MEKYELITKQYAIEKIKESIDSLCETPFEEAEVSDACKLAVEKANELITFLENENVENCEIGTTVHKYMGEVIEKMTDAMQNHQLCEIDESGDLAEQYRAVINQVDATLVSGKLCEFCMSVIVISLQGREPLTEFLEKAIRKAKEAEEAEKAGKAGKAGTE